MFRMSWQQRVPDQVRFWGLVGKKVQTLVTGIIVSEGQPRHPDSCCRASILQVVRPTLERASSRSVLDGLAHALDALRGRPDSLVWFVTIPGELPCMTRLAKSSMFRSLRKGVNQASLEE